MKKNDPNLYYFSVESKEYVYIIDEGKILSSNLISDKSSATVKRDKATHKNQLLNWFPEENKIGLSLVLTDECNLECKYCFEKDKDWHIDTFRNVTENYKLLILKVSKKYKNIHINFFGGEPLLSFNKIIDIVEYCKSLSSSHNFHYKLSTNGTLFDEEMVDYCKTNDFEIVISCDGGRLSQNVNRPAKNGNSFLMLQKSIDVLKRNNIKYHCRLIFTEETINNFNEDVSSLLQHGFDTIALFPYDGNYCGKLIGTSDIDEYIKNFNEFYYEIMKKNDLSTANKFLNVKWLLHLLLNKGKLNYYCGAGIDYFCILPDLSIYPCEPFVGKEEFCLNNTCQDDMPTPLEIPNVDKRMRCKECWARNLCGGGCRFSNYCVTSDHLQTNYNSCKLNKNYADLALKMFVKYYM